MRLAPMALVILTGLFAAVGYTLTPAELAQALTMIEGVAA